MMFGLIYAYCEVLADVSRNGHRAVWFREDDGTSPQVQTDLVEEGEYLSFAPIRTQEEFDLIVELL